MVADKLLSPPLAVTQEPMKEKGSLMLLAAIVFLFSSSLLQAQIEYSSTANRATVFVAPTAGASGLCEVKASLSADMRNAVLGRQVEEDAHRFVLEDLEPNQRYVLRVECDGAFVDATLLFTEPEERTPVPAREGAGANPCSIPPRQAETVGETGALIDLAPNPECGGSLTAGSSWLHVHPHATRARMLVEPNRGAARHTTVSVGGEDVVVRQTAGTGCSFSLGSSWYRAVRLLTS